MDEVRYMISEAAKKLQVESHVLRYWEEELGLEIGRTDMGHRYYTEDDIQLFLCIQKLKNEGMLLRDLKFMIPELTATRKRLNAAKREKEAAPAGATDAAKADTESGQESNATNLEAESNSEKQTGCANNLPADPPVSSEASSLTSAKPTAPEAEVIQMTQLEQVRSLIGDVLTDVVSANNETLIKDISRKVTSDVIREMDFLFQANERREEEHYRKLDVLIRQQQAGRREAAKDTPLGKLKKLLT